MKLFEQMQYFSEVQFKRFLTQMLLDFQHFVFSQMPPMKLLVHVHMLNKQWSIWCAFIALKSRVAPLKKLTTPCLELQGPVLAR